MLYLLDSDILSSKRMPSMSCEHCGSKETVHLQQYLSYLTILGVPITSIGAELLSRCTSCESVITQKEFSSSFKLAVENFDFNYKYPFKYHLIYFVAWSFWLIFVVKNFKFEGDTIDSFFIIGTVGGFAFFIIFYLLLEKVNQSPNFLLLNVFLRIGSLLFFILLFYFYYDKYRVKARAKAILYNKAIYFINQNIEKRTKSIQKEVERSPILPPVQSTDFKFIAELSILNMIWYLRKNGLDPNDFDLSNIRNSYPKLAFEINNCYDREYANTLENLEQNVKTRNNILIKKFVIKEKFRIVTMVAKLHNQVLWNKDIDINIVTEFLSFLQISPKSPIEYWNGLITKNGNDLLSFVFTETENNSDNIE